MTAIATALIDLARRIGRWVLNRVIAAGARRIGEYMIERAESVFARRLYRAMQRGDKRRIRWLRGRIERWRRWGTWLIQRSIDVADCVTKEADSLVAKAAKVPVVANCEKYRRAA